MGQRFAFDPGMGLNAIVSLSFAILIAGVSAEASPKNLNCVVFADFQNPEDQAYLASERVSTRQQCLQLAAEWTSARCFRYAGYGYLLTVIFDDPESVRNDQVQGPILTQCPRSSP